MSGPEQAPGGQRPAGGGPGDGEPDISELRLRDPDAALRGGAVFLPRSTYRRRRVLDALRLLPILGMILLALPVIWHGTGQDNVTAMTYVFGSWAVLIGAAAFLSRLTRRTEADAAPPDATRNPAGGELAGTDGDGT